MTEHMGAPNQKEFGSRSTADDVTAGIDLSGKTLLLTGCTSGIGFEAMKSLAGRGAHVIAVGRTQEKTEDACRSVSETGVAGTLTAMGCELESFAAVAKLADQVRALNTPIDILICNAGILGRSSLERIGDIEKQFAVNHLSHFILINRLLDQVKQATQGRIVIVASEAHRTTLTGGIAFDNLTGEAGYSALKFYGQSKLANLLTARELARRLEGTNITANALHPGVVATNIFKTLPSFLSVPLSVAGRLFMKSSAAGAATTCYLATNPALEKVSGVYFSDCNPKLPSEHGQDDSLARKLWDVSEGLTREYLV